MSLDRVVPRAARDGIEHASRIEARLIDPRVDDTTAVVVTPRGTGYRARSEWRVLNQQEAATLRKLLLDRHSWQPEAKKCEFNPTVLFQWIENGDTTRALVCHGCNQLLGWRDTTRFGGEFDPAADRFLSLSFAIFPTDTVLKKIIERNALADAQDEAEEQL